MSEYDWTIIHSGLVYWVYWRDQPKRSFATHKQAMRYIKLERRAAGEI